MNYEIADLVLDIKTLRLARKGWTITTPARVESARARLLAVSGLEVVELLFTAHEHPSELPEMF